MGKELSEMSLEEMWVLFPIILKEHNSDYINWYIEEKEKILNINNSSIIKRISHIGSSAVEGLISKPTIDILLEIDSNEDPEEFKNEIMALGWGLMSSQIEPYFNYSYCKGYTKNGFAEKVYHLHMRNLGDWSELYFRDYLQENAIVSNKYSELKIELQNKYRNNRDAYTDEKSEFVKYYSEKAKKHYGYKYNITKLTSSK